MDRIAHAKNTQRRNVFNDVAETLKLSPAIIEKDFWVSWILSRIFADSYLQSILCFKGGTALSKVLGIIERFSEDIDLILSTQIILKNGEKLEQETKNKQANFNKDIKNRAKYFISTTLKDKLSALLKPICEVQVDIEDDSILHVLYPHIFNDAYIKPDVKLEIGPLALWNPNDKYPVSSLVATALPELKLSTVTIPTIKPERTFWEKITILHTEHNRPTEHPIPARYSRHYYDVFKLAHTNVKETALKNTNLLPEVIAFNQRFYRSNWAKYEEAQIGALHLAPPAHNMSILANDYKAMQNMIYGDVPSWTDILDYLSELEKEINNL